MHSLSLAAVTAALALFHEASSAPATNGIATNLNELAKQKGKLWFGTAADIPQTNENAEQTDKTYLSILTDPRIFGEMTPANIMKVSLMFSTAAIKFGFENVLMIVSLNTQNPHKTSSTSPAATTSSTSPNHPGPKSGATTSSGSMNSHPSSHLEPGQLRPLQP